MLENKTYPYVHKTWIFWELQKENIARFVMFFNNLVRHIKLNQENMEILEKISAINMCIALTDTLCVLKFFSFFKSLNIERSIIFIVLCCREARYRHTYLPSFP